MKSGRDWTSTSSGSNATTTATRNAFATTDTTTTGRRLMQPPPRLSAVANARRRRRRRRGMMWANNRDRVDEGQRPSPRLAPSKTDRLKGAFFALNAVPFFGQRNAMQSVPLPLLYLPIGILNCTWQRENKGEWMGLAVSRCVWARVQHASNNRKVPFRPWWWPAAIVTGDGWTPLAPIAQDRLDFCSAHKKP